VSYARTAHVNTRSRYAVSSATENLARLLLGLTLNILGESDLDSRKQGKLQNDPISILSSTNDVNGVEKSENGPATPAQPRTSNDIVYGCGEARDLTTHSLSRSTVTAVGKLARGSQKRCAAATGARRFWCGMLALTCYVKDAKREVNVRLWQ
jgi:hypothetical protein